MRLTNKFSTLLLSSISIMPNLEAGVVETTNGFHVEGHEKIKYDFTFLDGVFEPQNPFSWPISMNGGVIAWP